MEDVTNHINNIGKDREAVKLTVVLTLEEVEQIFMCTSDAIVDGHADGNDTLARLNKDAKDIVMKYSNPDNGDG